MLISKGSSLHYVLFLILKYLRKILRINDVKEGLIVLVLPNMPEELRCTLLSKLRLVYPP